MRERALASSDLEPYRDLKAYRCAPTKQRKAAQRRD
jgi:hypothetical protein